MRALVARVVTALAFATIAVGTGGGAAWATQVDGNSYESPTFGYSLNWDAEVWTPTHEASADGVDTLVLEAADGLITLFLIGIASDAAPADCLESVVAGRAESGDFPGYGPLSGREVPPTGPGAAGGVFGYTLQTSGGEEVPLVQYVECRPLIPGEANLVLTLNMLDDPDVYVAGLALYTVLMETLEVPGGAGAGGDAADDRDVDEDEDDDGRASAGGRSGVDGNVYTSPTFGYTLTWDPAVWTVVEDSTEDGLDSLQVASTSGFSLVGFLASEGYGGDATGCRDDAGQILGETEGIMSYTPTPNVNDGTPLIGGDSALAFAIYDATYSDVEGSFQARVYVQCRTLVPGRAVLAVIWIVPTVAFDTDLAAFEGLLAGIDTSQAEVRESGSADDQDEDRATVDEDDEEAQAPEDDADRDADADGGDDASAATDDDDEEEDQAADDSDADADRYGSGGRNSEEVAGGSDDDD